MVWPVSTADGWCDGWMVVRTPYQNCYEPYQNHTNGSKTWRTVPKSYEPYQNLTKRTKIDPKSYESIQNLTKRTKIVRTVPKFFWPYQNRTNRTKISTTLLRQAPPVSRWESWMTLTSIIAAAVAEGSNWWWLGDPCILHLSEFFAQYSIFTSRYSSTFYSTSAWYQFAHFHWSNRHRHLFHMVFLHFLLCHHLLLPTPEDRRSCFASMYSLHPLNHDDCRRLHE